jgi:hypothetical protein
LCLIITLGLACGGGPASPLPEEQPPGDENSVPFPIDRGGDGEENRGTYKGLRLRLTDNGEPTVSAVDGLIGVVCVGMSNASQECTRFIGQVAGTWFAEVNRAVRIVNCAVGGHAIERWIDPAYDAVLWDDCIGRRLAMAGLRLDQVRVIYHKAANQFTTAPGGAPLPTYPEPGSDFEAFFAHLTDFAARVPQKFPSVQAVYTSSRSYGGFAGTPARGEPLSYEEGHALNQWLGQHPRVGGVWYGWGPYLWAGECGAGPSNGSGVCYQRADYVEDGVHPSTAGQLKISGLIHSRFRQHRWYRPGE